MLEAHLRGRYGESAPATYNRNLATITSLFTLCVDNDLIVRSPAKGLRRLTRRVELAVRSHHDPIYFRSPPTVLSLPLEDIPISESDRAAPTRGTGSGGGEANLRVTIGISPEVPSVCHDSRQSG